MKPNKNSDDYMDTIVENKINQKKSETSQSKTKDIASYDDVEYDNKPKFRIDSNNFVISENQNDHHSINYQIESISNRPQSLLEKCFPIDNYAYDIGKDVLKNKEIILKSNSHHDL